MQNEAAQARERRHAKFLTLGDRQVLVFLQRNADDALIIVFQLWVAATDEQLRIALTNFETEDSRVQDVFDSLCDNVMGELFEILGIPAIIAEVEARG